MKFIPTLSCNTLKLRHFLIRARGSPQPSITWLKDGHAMVDPRFDIRPDGSLVVQNVTNKDEGTFLCVADNGKLLICVLTIEPYISQSLFPFARC